jgi:hypothetical protein
MLFPPDLAADLARQHRHDLRLAADRHRQRAGRRLGFWRRRRVLVGAGVDSSRFGESTTGRLRPT